MFLRKSNLGFTLVEAIVVIFIFSIITLTFYSVFSLGGKYIIESKNRLAAIALANEKMEIVRNLSYDQVGVVGGIPSGSLPSEEDAVEGGKTYHVKTFVKYVDDPFDGTSPTDYDYKTVKITVSWDRAGGGTDSTDLVSRFVPPGLEEASSGGGILSINIINSSGIGVPQATVHITNTDVSPTIDITAMTDNTGNLMLPGAPQSIQKYDINVAKSGYETVNTIDPSTVTYSVTDTPASVVAGMMNTKTIVEDILANLKINSVDYLGNPLPSVGFHIEGGRILGSDVSYSPAMPEYNLVSDSTTDSSGESDFNSISPGQFFISKVGAISGYTFIGLDNFSGFDNASGAYSFLVSPGQSGAIKMRFANNNDNSLLVDVTKSSDGTPIQGAQAVLTNSGGYSATVTTGADGVAFFPVSSEPMIAGGYSLSITATGYAAYNSSVNIDKLTLQPVQLTSN